MRLARASKDKKSPFRLVKSHPKNRITDLTNRPCYCQDIYDENSEYVIDGKQIILQIFKILCLQKTRKIRKSNKKEKSSAR